MVMTDQAVQRSWWSRHWKWAVPSICLAGLLAVVGFVALLLAIIFGALKSSDAYAQSLALARADPRVQAALGSPIEPGFLVTGQMKIVNSRGRADLSYAITGPKGTGAVHVVAAKSGGPWVFSIMTVETASPRQMIDLLDPGP